ncbi:hypothetical protein OkiPb00196_18490 [Escherichia coli]
MSQNCKSALRVVSQITQRDKKNSTKIDKDFLQVGFRCYVMHIKNRTVTGDNKMMDSGGE